MQKHLTQNLAIVYEVSAVRAWIELAALMNFIVR